MGLPDTQRHWPKVIAWIVFLLYCALLLKLTVFRGPASGLFMYNLADRLKWANFIPFRTIAFYLDGKETFATAWRNLAGNVAAFLPMGVLLPVVLTRLRRMRSILAYSLAISLFIEVVQLFTGLGSFDVDDILLNVLGAAIGGLAVILCTRTSPSPSSGRTGPWPPSRR